MPGRTYEQFHEGDTISHMGALSITQADNEAFCRLTHNDQPLHWDAAVAQQAGFRDVLVNGLYTFAASVGLTVPDTTEGTLIANLGYEDVRHPHPVHPGDVLRVSTTVASKRPSSKPGRGLVVLQHTVTNQDDMVVCDFRRTVLVQSGGAAS